MEFLQRGEGKEGSWLDMLRKRGVKIEDKVDGMGAAWTEAGRGWIGMYMHHHIDFGVGGWKALLQG